jgi:hypothetical protein
MGTVEWVHTTDDLADDPAFDGEGFYVVASTGIVAGKFDDEGEGMWWLDKAATI